MLNGCQCEIESQNILSCCHQAAHYLSFLRLGSCYWPILQCTPKVVVSSLQIYLFIICHGILVLVLITWMLYALCAIAWHFARELKSGPPYENYNSDKFLYIWTHYFWLCSLCGIVLHACHSLFCIVAGMICIWETKLTALKIDWLNAILCVRK